MFLMVPCICSHLLQAHGQVQVLRADWWVSLEPDKRAEGRGMLIGVRHLWFGDPMGMWVEVIDKLIACQGRWVLRCLARDMLVRGRGMLIEEAVRVMLVLGQGMLEMVGVRD